MATAFSSGAWIIPLLPLAAFAVLLALGRSLGRAGAWLATGCSLVALLLSLAVVTERMVTSADDYRAGYTWIHIGDYVLNAGFEITNLTAMMLVVVTLVGFLVQVYSLGYMKDDERITVFFGYVSLFLFAMLGLVLSDNLLIFYVFWELVGACSFLLIGFWYQKPEARAAAKKAFIVTRIGDLGLLLAILLLFWYMPDHALDFVSLHNVFDGKSGAISLAITTLIALLIFLGAAGKSGQFPLHVWLPDAMEGPTPISALIHAATMVAAGVFLVARTYDIFEASPAAMETMASIGAFTALFAAVVGLAQNDIKRVLAYSTISQLGYMMLALGVGSETGAMFHLVTHAFFKALLFLGAGSIIHAAHTQDIREMGGLGKRMRTTAWTFGVGALALSGIPPLAGFWSKDGILTAVLTDHPWLFVVGIAAAFCTALYMAKLFLLVFFGKPRGKIDALIQAQPIKESPAIMTVPLVVLALLTGFVGFINTPMNNWLGRWLTGSGEGETASALALITSVAVSLLGLYVGWLMYGRGTIRPSGFASRAPGLVRLAERQFYMNELYEWLFVRSLRAAGAGLAAFDAYVVDGAVKLAGAAVGGIGRLNSRLQQGQIQAYLLAAVVGFIVLIVAVAGRRFW